MLSSIALLKVLSDCQRDFGFFAIPIRKICFAADNVKNMEMLLFYVNSVLLPQL